MDTKRRRSFYIYKSHKDFERLNWFARGLLYDEGNVQVLWREDVGHCAEQYSDLLNALAIAGSTPILEVREQGGWRRYK